MSETILSKISQVQVDGNNYDINLPTTATPSITSLSVSGGITADTINASTITASSYINTPLLSVANLTLSASESIIYNSPSITISYPYQASLIVENGLVVSSGNIEINKDLLIYSDGSLLAHRIKANDLDITSSKIVVKTPGASGLNGLLYVNTNNTTALPGTDPVSMNHGGLGNGDGDTEYYNYWTLNSTASYSDGYNNSFLTLLVWSFRLKHRVNWDDFEILFYKFPGEKSFKQPPAVFLQENENGQKKEDGKVPYYGSSLVSDIYRNGVNILIGKTETVRVTALVIGVLED